jgi:hypothetical protein
LFSTAVFRFIDTDAVKSAVLFKRFIVFSFVQKL